MTPEGYAKVNEALSNAQIAAEIGPVPQPGENVRFVDIRTNGTENLTRVLNTLGGAGLMAAGWEDGTNVPILRFVASELRTVAGSDPRPPLQASARFTTFEDLAVTQ